MAAVLIVDDDPAMLEMMLALIDGDKHQVIPSQQLAEAKEMMEYAFFDYVFLDGMNQNQFYSLSSFLKTLPPHFSGEIVCISNDDAICHELRDFGVKRRVLKFEVADWLDRQIVKNKESA